MLFHEIHGSYYQAVSAILQEAVRGTLTRKRLNELVQTHAFGESLLNIPDGLTGERWRLLHRDLTPELDNEPERPLTLLEKRWLRSLLLDARIRLFDVDMHGLETVKPLFTPDMFVFFDRYVDGDDYHDPEYIAHFKTVLTALREKKNLYITYHGQRSFVVTPHHLEYSEKDDCFRLIASGARRSWVIRLSRVLDCSVVESSRAFPLRPRETETLVFELEDERRALERVLLHFSHLEKETKRLDETHYRVTLRYDPADETEMVIRILSFGPVIRVLEPARFIEQLRDRIERQRRLSAFLPESTDETAAREDGNSAVNEDRQRRPEHGDGSQSRAGLCPRAASCRQTEGGTS